MTAHNIGRRGIRRLSVLACGAAVVLTGVGACSGSGAPTPEAGTGTVTVGGDTASLAVSSCTRQGDAVQVVAQRDGTWTMNLRHDKSSSSTVFVLVHHTAAGMQMFQASSNALHPKGLPPTSIDVSRLGDTFAGTATVRSATGGETDPAAPGSAPADGTTGDGTVAARFEVTCATITPPTSHAS